METLKDRSKLVAFAFTFTSIATGVVLWAPLPRAHLMVYLVVGMTVSLTGRPQRPVQGGPADLQVPGDTGDRLAAPTPGG
jgi:hypothetical protein